MIQMTAIGRVGGDAKVKTVGKRVVINFSIAINKRRVNSDTGEMTEETNWVNCALWRDQEGSLPQYLKKGQQVYVQGEPAWKVYKKQDNRPGIDMSLLVSRVELLGSKKDDQAAPGSNDDDKDYKWDDDVAAEEYTDAEAANAGAPVPQDDLAF